MSPVPETLGSVSPTVGRSSVEGNDGLTRAAEILHTGRSIRTTSIAAWRRYPGLLALLGSEARLLQRFQEKLTATLLRSVCLATAIAGLALCSCSLPDWRERIPIAFGRLICEVGLGDHPGYVQVSDQNGLPIWAIDQDPTYLAKICRDVNGVPAPPPSSGLASTATVDTRRISTSTPSGSTAPIFPPPPAIRPLTPEPNRPPQAPPPGTPAPENAPPPPPVTVPAPPPPVSIEPPTPPPPQSGPPSTGGTSPSPHTVPTTPSPAPHVEPPTNIEV